MVLIVGIDEIKSQRNIDRLKRELKTCYPLVDRLMDSLDCGGMNNKYFTDIVGLAECFLCPENHLIQVHILFQKFLDCLIFLEFYRFCWIPTWNTWIRYSVAF